MSNIPVEFTGAVCSGINWQLGVRVKRADGSLYCPKTQLFMAPGECPDPFIPMVQGTGDEQTLLTAQIPATPSWQDGTYRCYIHDLGLPEHTVYWVNEVEIMKGDWNWKTPTTTDIATRLMNINVASHNQTGTLGANLNRMLQLLEYIATGIEKLLSQTSGISPVLPAPTSKAKKK